ncbi:MAG: hypothetical protein ACLPH3_02975 [Terracidiphilus sp.]
MFCPTQERIDGLRRALSDLERHTVHGTDSGEMSELKRIVKLRILCLEFAAAIRSAKSNVVTHEEPAA